MDITTRTTDWHLQGDWFDVCSCKLPCPCSFAQEPTHRAAVAGGSAAISTPDVAVDVAEMTLVDKVAGREDEIPPPQPGDPPIGQTVLFPFTLRVPYAMLAFSAAVPTPDTRGRFDEEGAGVSDRTCGRARA